MTETTATASECVDHRAVAFMVARSAIVELRDTGAMDMSEIAGDKGVELSDDDYDPIGEAISDIADLLDAYLDDQEGGAR